ncbi:MAG TPA: hypothetical protein VF187_10685, partial [Gemmatimonadales bacterium]
MSAIPAIYTHPRCLDHDPGPGHPESPARLRAVLSRVELEWPGALRHARPAPRDALRGVHGAEYLDGLEALS